jgi:hypothetical protein
MGGVLTARFVRYAETAKVLYSANTFPFYHQKELVESHIPLAHLGSIRSLHLDWYFNNWTIPSSLIANDLRAWKRVVDVLSESFVSLSHFTVFLGHFVRPGYYCCVSLPEPSIPPDASIEAEVFKQLKRITPPKDFVVLRQLACPQGCGSRRSISTYRDRLGKRSGFEDR